MNSDYSISHFSTRKFSNAEENDLWYAMARATPSDPALKDLNVVDFMNSWTKQAGYPVVNVNRNYETGHVEFEQVKSFSSLDISFFGSSTHRFNLYFK